MWTEACRHEVDVRSRAHNFTVTLVPVPVNANWSALVAWHIARGVGGDLVVWRIAGRVGGDRARLRASRGGSRLSGCMTLWDIKGSPLCGGKGSCNCFTGPMGGMHS